MIWVWTDIYDISSDIFIQNATTVIDILQYDSMINKNVAVSQDLSLHEYFIATMTDCAGW